MKRKDRLTAKVLCANKCGDKQQIVRVAVLVKRGQMIERVVIVDVERKPEGYLLQAGRSDEMIMGIAKDKATWPNLGTPGESGVRIVAAAFDGMTLTGLGQPREADTVFA